MPPIPQRPFDSRRRLTWSGAFLALGFFFCGSPVAALAQLDGFDLWQEITEQQAAARLPAALKATAKREIVPQAYRTLALNKASMAQLLAAAPAESPTRSPDAGSEILLPLPQGGYGRFSVLESPIMEPALAAQFPEIKNYILQGVDDPTATGRIDTSPKGFRAMVISASGTFFIDPYWSNNNDASICYSKKDFTNADKLREWTCGVVGDNSPIARAARTLAAQPRPTGATLRVYRAAIAATGEYTAFHGGTVVGALAAINTSLARVNTVYERDFCIRMVLVGNNSSIIYTNAAADPYTNGDPGLMINQNQTNVDAVIGNANYDIGHVFGTDSGGLAGLGVVCLTGQKARGVTGSSAPVNDPFDIDYVAHEMGHQFAGNHTFNASGNSNRNASTAFEPGSGSTVMAYAGIVAGQDLQANSDDHFHTGSYTEIDNYTSSGVGAGAISNIATGNAPPVIGALSNYTIPAQTPFALTASATDANGDTLTYCWEEYDTGAAQNPTVNPRDNGASPIFRSYRPSTNATRLFPSLQYILNNTNVPPATYISRVTNNSIVTTNTNATGEFLPTTSRTMTYRVSVRDNRAGGGGQNWNSLQVTTISNAGPFRISSQNTATTVSPATPFNVTWDVAGTTNAPISAANVKISLSTNGGTNFPVVLAESVPNNGSASVTIPGGTTTTAGRLKVEAVGNIFFDVNDANLTVSSAFVAGQITLADTNSFTENFDSMGASATAALPNGLKMTAAGQGTSAGWDTAANLTNVTQQASTGSPTSGGRYNWGSSATDRSAGFMTSGSYASPNGVMAKVVNNTGSTMTGLNVSFDIERYRINTAAANVTFFTSVDGATWTSVPAGDSGAFATGASSYTFAGGTVVSKNLSLLGLSISNGGAIYLKWNFNTTGGNSQGLGLDNLALQAVVPSANAPVITSASTASAVGFTSFSYQITASQSPTSYNATGLPAGLSVDTATGLISGTPTEQGTFNVTLAASNGSGTGTAPLTLTVTKNPGAPTITSPLSVGSALNAPFSYQVEASNSPTTYSASNLQTGLSIDTTTGLISGTPTAGGVRNVIITASNALGTDTQTLVLFIGTAAVVGAPTTASAYTSAAVSWQVIATGPATGYSATGLPAGFSINTSTGLITGTASATPGTSTFQVTATNPLGSDTKTFTLAVLDQAAQNAIPLNVVVNKYANSTPDQIQLLVVGNGTPGSTVDMRGMIIKDFSSNMASDGGGKYAFADNVLWAAVPSGSFITLSTGATSAEDFDLADFYVAANLDNTTYFTNLGGAGAVLDIGTTEMIMIKAAGTGALGSAGGIHCMGSGTAGAQFNAFLGAKLLGSGTTAAGNGAFANNATPALSDYGASGQQAATGATGATPIASLDFASWNNSSNQAYVISLRGSSTTPAILASPSSLSGLIATQGAPGVSTNFTASASNLSNNITVTANDAVNFAISTNNTDFTNTLTLLTNGTGGVSNTPVYVRLTGASQGAQSNSVSLVSGSTSTNVIVAGTVIDPAAPNITPTPTALSGFTTLRGTASTNQTVTITGTNLGGSNIAVVSSNNFYEISTNSFATPGSNSLTLASTGGIVAVRISTNAPATNSLLGNLALSGGGATNNVPLSGVVTNLTPLITVNPTNLPAFSSTVNLASTAQSFTAEGSNLSNNITVTPPQGFALALSNTDGSFSTNALTLTTNSSNAVPNTTVFVRMIASAVATNFPPANIVLASSGATNRTVLVSGTVNFRSLTFTGSLSNFSTMQGVASPPQSFVLQGSGLTSNVTVSASPANLEFSTNSGGAYTSSLVLPLDSGALSNTVFARIPGTAPLGGPVTNTITASTAFTNATLSAVTTVTANTNPSISVNPTNLTGFLTQQGTASTNQTVTVSGTNLQGPLTVTASANYEVSRDGTNFASSLLLAPVARPGITPASSGPTVIGSDTAGNYGTAAANTWTNGANLGSGFGPWQFDVTTGSNGFAGVFLGDPTTAGIAGLPAPAFGMYANPGPSGAAATVNRAFAAPLNVGDTFSFKWAVNWDSDVGNKGFSIFAGTNQLANVNQSGFPGNITFNGTNTALQFGTGPMTWSVALTASNNLFVTSTPRDGGTNIAFSTNITVAAAPTSFRWYVSAMGQGDQRQPYFNDLQITSSGGGGGNVADTTLYVRIAGTAAATNSLGGSISLSSAGAGPASVTLSGRVAQVTTSTSSLNPFVSPDGVASEAQTFTVSGAGLGTTPITITAPIGFEISENGGVSYTNSLTLIPTGGAVSSTSISVRMTAGQPVGSEPSGDITVSSPPASRSVAVSGSVVPPGPLITFSPLAGVSGLFTTRGTPSAAQQVTVNGYSLGATNLVASAPEGLEVSLSQNSGFASSAEFVPNDAGRVSNALLYIRIATNAPTGPLSLSVGLSSGSVAPGSVPVTGNVAPEPIISLLPAAMTNPFSTVTGFASAAQSVTVGGTNLIGNLRVQVPAGYELTTNGTTYTTFVELSPQSGTVTSTALSVRLSATNLPGSPSGNIQATSSNAVTLTSAVQGTVLPRPVITTSTNAITGLSARLGFVSTNTGQFTVSGQNLLTNVLVTATTTNFQISLNATNNFTNQISLPGSGGALAATNIYVRISTNAALGPVTGNIDLTSGIYAATNTVAVSGNVIRPEITVNSSNIQTFVAAESSPSSSQFIGVSGTNLVNAIVVTAPQNYQVSRNSDSGFSSSVSIAPSAGVVDATLVYVRIAATAPAGTLPAASLSIASAGDASSPAADTQTVPLVGSVQPWPEVFPLSMRILAPASQLTNTNSSFDYIGQAGIGLTNPIQWSNALTGQTGIFSAATTWTNAVLLGTGTNTVTFRTSYRTYDTNVIGEVAFDAPQSYINGWFNGSSGGFGFAAWQLTATNGATNFRTTSATNLNLPGSFQAFTLRGGTNGLATAQRMFQAPLVTASSFEIKLDPNAIAAGGSLGLALSAGTNRVFSFSAVNATGQPAFFSVEDAGGSRLTPIPYITTGFSWKFELLSATNYRVTAIGSSPVVTNSFVGTIAPAAIDTLVLSNRASGPDTANNFYAGIMQIFSPAFTDTAVTVVAPAVVRTSPAPTSAYDQWASGYGLNPATNGALSSDPDADSYSNASEFAFGTDPTKADGTLTQTTTQSGQLVVVYLERTSGAQYAVKSTSNLAAGPWLPAAVVPTPSADTANVPAGYRRMQFSVSASGNGFYRLEAILP